jgi:hypothetical protein
MVNQYHSGLAWTSIDYEPHELFGGFAAFELGMILKGHLTASDSLSGFGPKEGCVDNLAHPFADEAHTIQDFRRRPLLAERLICVIVNLLKIPGLKLRVEGFHGVLSLILHRFN